MAHSGTENLLGFFKTLVDIQTALNKENHAKAPVETNPGSWCPTPNSEAKSGEKKNDDDESR